MQAEKLHPLPALLALILINLSASSGFAVPTTTTAPDNDAKNITQLKDESRRQLSLRWQNVPSIGEKTASDVLNFRFDHDRLIAESNLPHDFANHLVQMHGLPGQAMIRFNPSRLGQGGFLAFEYYDFSKPETIDVHDQILSSPLALQVDQDIEYPDRTQTVTLIQSYVPSDSDDVTMRVQSILEIDNHSIVNFVVTAPTFSALRREHPTEVERYIRPIFASLGQDSGIFGVDEKLAWQVVADTWKPQANLPKQVMDVVAILNDDSYTKREDAEKELRKLGEPAALYLMSTDRKPLSGEQNARIDEFLHSYRPLSEDQVQPLRTDPSFLLDAMSTSDDTLRAAVFEHLQKAVGHEVKFDLTMGTADRAAAIASLRHDLVPTPVPLVPTSQPAE